MDYCVYDKDSEDYLTKSTEFIIVSAVIAIFSGPETYIFPASGEGKVLDWIELKGSFRGGLNHNEALEKAGYILI